MNFEWTKKKKLVGMGVYHYPQHCQEEQLCFNSMLLNLYKNISMLKNPGNLIQTSNNFRWMFSAYCETQLI